MLVQDGPCSSAKFARRRQATTVLSCLFRTSLACPLCAEMVGLRRRACRPLRAHRAHERRDGLGEEGIRSNLSRQVGRGGRRNKKAGPAVESVGAFLVLVVNCPRRLSKPSPKTASERTRFGPSSIMLMRTRASVAPRLSQLHRNGLASRLHGIVAFLSLRGTLHRAPQCAALVFVLPRRAASQWHRHSRFWQHGSLSHCRFVFVDVCPGCSCFETQWRIAGEGSGRRHGKRNRLFARCPNASSTDGRLDGGSGNSSCQCGGWW